MWHFLKVYLATLPIFFAIDFLWLGIITSGFYKSELGILARLEGNSLKPVIWAAGIVYLLIPLGILLFVVPRTSSSTPWLSAFLWGFLYGVILYGIYDMTNYSLINKWPLRMSMVDIMWGGIICSITTVIMSFLDRWFA